MGRTIGWYAGDDATVGGAIAAGLGAAVLGLAIYWQARGVTHAPNATVDERTAAAR
jgi:hypothetical protein